MEPKLMNSTLAPGMTVETWFDFINALDSFKTKIKSKISRNQWDDSINEAFYICLHATKVDKKTSALWFSVKFLDALWYLFFGKANGSSPWRAMLDKLSSSKSNGKGDYPMDLTTLRWAIEKNPDKVEIIIHDRLGQYFPMAVSKCLETL
ncbi:hypothetical protein F4819DRAFT_475254 [Hypoxylon fuscum]|nr:hypothetical protein F4819DRAFT_475254 [Hypoxylon fuscum]